MTLFLYLYKATFVCLKGKLSSYTGRGDKNAFKREPCNLEEKEAWGITVKKNFQNAIKAPCSFNSNSAKGEVFPSDELHHGGVLGVWGAVAIPGDRGGARLTTRCRVWEDAWLSFLTTEDTEENCFALLSLPAVKNNCYYFLISL